MWCICTKFLVRAFQSYLPGLLCIQDPMEVTISELLEGALAMFSVLCFENFDQDVAFSDAVPKLDIIAFYCIYTE